jgi:SAM-dependent methyltransferase
MSSPVEHYPIIVYHVEGQSILDAACGLGRLGYYLRTSSYKQPSYLIGIDLFLPNLEFVRDHRVYDDVVLCDISHIPFRNNSFATVIAREVLEHVEKRSGFDCLKEIERVGWKKLILSTPRDPGQREGFVTPIGFNPYEAHLSRWSLGELRSLGYIVYGVGFRFSNVFGKYQAVVDLLAGYSFYKFPRLAGFLIAVKHLRKSGK